MECVLGLDAGGTKTLAVVAQESGRVLGVGRAGSANFQSCGTAGASSQLGRAVELALAEAEIEPGQIKAVCYGISGADRAQDFQTVDEIVRPIVPCPLFRLENDTIIALRAGTVDGVGLALIAGTGANAIGRDERGRTVQVGGLGRLTGDFGSAGQLAEAAVMAAFMSQDGRGPETCLLGKICKQLNLEKIEDIIEFEFFDMPRESPLDMGTLAPLVFDAAAEGDGVAKAVLVQAGQEVGRAACAVLEQLFPAADREIAVVLGGSVFMHGRSPELVQTVSAAVLEARPRARIVKLKADPVLGAVGFAFDDLGWDMTDSAWTELRASYSRAGGSGS